MTNTTFYYSDAPYQQALQGLYKALSSPEALVKLIGTAHTGKSTLCAKLALYLQRKGYRVVHFQYAIESPDMLRAQLARQLDLPNATNFARMLEDIPLDADDKPLILLFDEAHLLTETTLLEIFRLIEVQSGAGRKINVALSGEPSLEQRLASRPALKSLLLHISHTVVLPAMSTAETAQFVTAYLAKAALPDLILEPAAMTYLYKLANGLPGPASTLCSLIVAARRAQSEQAPLGKEELRNLVQQAQSQSTQPLLPTSQLRDTNQWVVLGPIAAVVVFASIGMLYQQLAGQEDAQPLPDADAQYANLDSPFVTETAVADVAAEIVVPEVSQVQAIEPPAALPDVPDVPVSDSDLVLVTAAERGVAAAQIVEPVFEEVAEVAEEAMTAVTAAGALTQEAIQEAAQDITQEAVAIVAIPDAPATTPAPPDSPAPDAGADQRAALVAVDPPALTPPQPAIAAATPTATPATAPAAITVAPDTTVVETAPSAAVPAPENPANTATVAAVETLVSNADSANNVDSASSAVIAGNVTNASNATRENEASADVQVRAAVDTWMTAWQAQDLEAYFASYHPEFVPRYQSSQQAWRQNRTRVIGNAASIQLSRSDYALIASSAEQMEVQFWLAYQSPTYADDTLKKLVFGLQDGRWLILEEVNLQVR